MPSFARRPRRPKATRYYFTFIILLTFLIVAFLFGRLHESSAYRSPTATFVEPSAYSDPSVFTTDNAYHVQNSHPRLFATTEMWSHLPVLIESDPYLARWNQTIFDNAQDLHDKPTVKSPSRLGGSGKLDEAREVQLRLKHWAYVYRLTKQSRWKNRIWQEILAATNDPRLDKEDDDDVWNSR